MKSVNIIGRLGADPVIRENRNGNPFVIVQVAIANGKTQDGSQLDPTWVPVTINGDSAKALAKYGRKGRQLSFQGDLTSYSADRKVELEVTLEMAQKIVSMGQSAIVETTVKENRVGVSSARWSFLDSDPNRSEASEGGEPTIRPAVKGEVKKTVTATRRRAEPQAQVQMEINTDPF
jgi:single-stranded DNA-binding protein